MNRDCFRATNWLYAIDFNQVDDFQSWEHVITFASGDWHCMLIQSKPVRSVCTFEIKFHDDIAPKPKPLCRSDQGWLVENIDDDGRLFRDHFRND